MNEVSGSPTRSEVDGVPAWWRPSEAETLTASLMFRVGQVDQRVIEGGWIELLLDLAFHRLSVPAYLRFEADTGPCVTRITVSGPAGEAAVLLSALAERVWRPNPQDVAARVEAVRGRVGGGLYRQALFWRFGAVGLGVGGLDTIGLYAASPERLAAYARGVFARGNAALVLDGAPPPTLRLDLPAGPRLPVPEQRQVLRTPASYQHRGESVILSGLLPRSISARLTSNLVQARAFRSLRDVEGISYSPQGGYSPVGDQAVAALFVDVQPGAETRAVAAVSTALSDLASAGPHQAELDDERRALLQQLRDPSTRDAMAWSYAEAELTGRPLLSLADLESEAVAVTTQAIARDASYWRNSALLGLPDGVEAPTEYPSTTPPTDPALAQILRTHHRRDPEAGDAAENMITLSAAGVMKGNLCFRFADVVALGTWPDGLRVLVRSDGYQLAIEPNMWEYGRDLVRSIDAAISPELLVPMPPRDAEDIPESSQASALAERIAVRGRAVRRLPWLIVLNLLVLGGVDLLLAGDAHFLLILAIGMAVCMGLGYWVGRRALVADNARLTELRSGG